MTKLIILRGPSGAGKSTVAKRLHEIDDRKSVLIEQDYYKEVMVRPKTEPYDVRMELIVQNALAGLRHGYDVILDGIFSMPSWAEPFEQILVEHPRENYAFYFDVSLDETLKRHKTRLLAQRFGEAEMREWFQGGITRLAKDFEHIIPESNSLEQTVEFIRKTAGLL